MNESETQRLTRLTNLVIDMASVRGAVQPKWKSSQDSIDRLAGALKLLQERLWDTLFDNVETQKFAQAFENASDQIVIADERGTILNANKALKRVSGYAPKDVRGKSIDAPDLWYGKMPRTFFVELWKTVREKQKDFKREIECQHADGSTYVSEVHVSPVWDEAKNLRYLVIIEHDITQQKRLEQAKDNFLSIASHELQTPLTAIHWHIEMLKNQELGELNEKQQEFIETIEQVSKRLSSLVKMLLNTSRIDVGSVAIKPQPVDLRSVAQTALKQMQGAIAQKRLKIKEQYPKSIKKIPLDKNLIQVALSNLLSNAVKYNKDRGSVTVEIQKTKDGYTVSVSDTGIGIPANQHANIFDRLFRADNARISNIEGSGLGLYITRWIAESAGGTISFVSKEGKGSTFTLFVPLAGMTAKKGAKTLEVD